MSIHEPKRAARGFVLIDVVPRRTREVVDELLEHDEVIEAHIIPGEHDIMAVLGVKRTFLVPDTEMIAKFVLDKIVKIPGVKDTSTIVPAFSKTKLPE